MAILDKRITIYTQEGSPKFGARALVLDLNKGVNHKYDTTVAKHAIEGGASSQSDHSYLNNIKISISGHISDAVAVAPSEETDSYLPYAPDREDDAQVDTVQETLETQLENDLDIGFIEVGVPITAAQAELLNENTVFPEGFPEYVEGQVVNDVERGVAEFNSSDSLDSLLVERDTLEAIAVDKKEVLRQKNLRIIYQTDASRKQLDAFELLEGIFHGRILLDLLTNYRLYENMVMTSLQLPREMGAGQAFEIRASFEQQSFTSAQEGTVEVTTSANKKDITNQKDNGKKEGTGFSPTASQQLMMDKIGIKVKTAAELLLEGQ